MSKNQLKHQAAAKIIGMAAVSGARVRQNGVAINGIIAGLGAAHRRRRGAWRNCAWRKRVTYQRAALWRKKHTLAAYHPAGASASGVAPEIIARRPRNIGISRRRLSCGNHSWRKRLRIIGGAAYSWRHGANGGKRGDKNAWLKRHEHGGAWRASGSLARRRQTSSAAASRRRIGLGAGAASAVKHRGGSARSTSSNEAWRAIVWRRLARRRHHHRTEGSRRGARGCVSAALGHRRRQISARQKPLRGAARQTARNASWRGAASRRVFWLAAACLRAS